MLRNLLASLIVFLCVGSVAHAIKITDSANPHNLSFGSSGVKATASSMDQICVFCHTPHSAAPKSPLWNRPNPLGPNNDGTFPLYNSPTLGINKDAAAITLTGYENTSMDLDGVPLYPNGASRLCLSCHDGVTSVGVLLDNQTIAMTSDIASAIDLESSHPISFNYSPAVIAGVPLPGYTMPDGTVSVPLTGGKMQCTTCHDPHESTSSLPAYDNLPFWRHQADGASYVEVCNSCHSGVPSAGIHPIP